jgi:rSAM/selenodomain-associated transferase 1
VVTGSGIGSGIREVTIVLLAKEPLPGRVKTRLTPPYSPNDAAALAEAALLDTVAAIDAVPGVRPVCALDGQPSGWLPSHWLVCPQRSGDLGDRIAGAFDDAYAAAGGPVLLVGMDTPQLHAAHLTAALAGLADHDAVLGPAADGGWWLLGLHRADASLVTGIPTSRVDTGLRQRERLVGKGLRVLDLQVLRDVDTAADAAEVAALAPGSRFAARMHELRRVA